MYRCRQDGEKYAWKMYQVFQFIVIIKNMGKIWTEFFQVSVMNKVIFRRNKYICYLYRYLGTSVLVRISNSFLELLKKSAPPTLRCYTDFTDFLSRYFDSNFSFLWLLFTEFFNFSYCNYCPQTKFQVSGFDKHWNIISK